ncbi:SDR family oxidoreductase [Crystallibacter degradans]|uniref:SDR family oxidoreductase n=1 Tax=Crystallibacter degradans TaxID=2726743 RepID=UPI00147276EF|nr:NAD(P)H-binding protein [Arthrobacter sp. SF27]NMR31757.1 NAD(P)H-binding protein [Arthrobacter sp. SF27]
MQLHTNQEHSTTAPVLITGGTGTLGRHLVPRLLEAGCRVRVLSRTSREPMVGVEFVTGDLATGEGIEAAVERVETIVHAAGSGKGDDEKAHNLVRAAAVANVRHLVYISVVGADRTPITSGVDRAMFGYVGAKRTAELIIANSGLPYTTLRATQFHDLVLMMAQGMAKLSVIPVPAGFNIQPVDAAEVAARLVQLALGEPAGLVPEMGGPEVHPLAELIRGYLRATGRRRLIVPVRMPGGAARAFRDGANLVPEHTVGRRTWDDFLAEHIAVRSYA